MFEELTEDNFLLFAIKNYDNPSCKGMSEFHDDVKRFKYLKRLFRKSRKQEVKDRLILNHLIVLYNIFGTEAATRMLFYKIDAVDWPELKTFLVFLNFMPERIHLPNNLFLDSSEIPLNEEIINTLRSL